MPEVIDIHAEIKEHWYQPNEIVKELNAQNAKETTSKGNLPLHTLFIKAIGVSVLKIFNKGHLDIMKKLLELHPDGIKHKNEKGQLPVHCAILPKHGRYCYAYHTPSPELFESVKCLLSSYPESLSMKDNDGIFFFL